MESASKFRKYVPKVRAYIRDLPGITMLPNFDDGTEFSDQEIIMALRFAHQLWRNVPMHTPFMPIIPTPEVELTLLKAAAGYLFKNKVLEYARNTISYGDVIQVRDFEDKISIYQTLAQQLISEAEREFAIYKNYFITNTKGYEIKAY